VRDRRDENKTPWWEIVVSESNRSGELKMDEQKPTYEELLEEKRINDHNSRWDSTFSSLVTFIVVITSYLCISELAEFGLSQITESIWAELIFRCANVIIIAYIVWHEAFAQMYINREQIEKWCTEHNFFGTKPKSKEI
jgi:hypothetical protein